MEIPVKTLKSGFSLPVYGLGTWQMGGRGEPDYSNDETEIAAIKSAIDHGIAHIDTAESYGGGHAEELVAQAIKDYDRSKLIIATKVSGDHQGYDGVMKAIEASLKRLQLNYVDLYLLHRYPAPGISITDTMKAMDRLVSEGVVKNIGVCNMTINRLEEAQKHSQNKIVYNQLHYSLTCREAEKKGLVKYCQDNDVFLSAWGPLEKGMLEQGGVLQEMAEKYSKTPYQVALNWLITQPNVITIPKTTSVKHLEENLGALGWELSKEDMEKLTKDFPGQYFTSDRVPLDYEADVEP
jgi:diketogulonate reductase-like aldo/keto reductase